MAQKIKLELTEREAKILETLLVDKAYEIAKVIESTSPVKSALRFQYFRDQHNTIVRILERVHEPYLV